MHISHIISSLELATSLWCLKDPALVWQSDVAKGVGAERGASLLEISAKWESALLSLHRGKIRQRTFHLVIQYFKSSYFLWSQRNDTFLIWDLNHFDTLIVLIRLPQCIRIPRDSHLVPISTVNAPKQTP